MVDPRPEALALGKQRLSEVAQRSLSTSYRWLNSMDQATPNGDLCIVGTLAEGRCRLVMDVVESLGFNTFLLEKVVGQSTKELEELLHFTRSRGVSTWVNCKGRAYDFHLRAKEKLNPDDSVVFTIVGGNHGLATNGVHAADLFAFYDGATCIKSRDTRIDPILHPAKRGNAIFDLSGTLSGYTDKGSQMSLSYTPDHQNYEHFSIATRDYRCIVDQVQRWAMESDASSGWAWRQVPFDGPILVSEMTKKFAADIIDTGRCQLPTLEQSLVAHRFILDELRPHFCQLLGREVELCPVT